MSDNEMTTICDFSSIRLLINYFLTDGAVPSISSLLLLLAWIRGLPACLSA